MPTFIKSMILSCIFLAVQLLFSQNLTSSLLDKSLREKIDNADRSDFRYIPKKAGHYSAEEWRAVIDSTWGEGIPIEKKLQFFDMCWNLIDREYPSFFHIEDQWDSFKDLYRPEIEAGVSRGRFAAIMNHMYSKLTDIHSTVADVPVASGNLNPGTPLFVASGVTSMDLRILHFSDYCHFGASLAPLPDSTVFVYDVIANHPLGLERGDIILGYDNIAWKKLYRELMEAELPMYLMGVIGSNPKSALHSLLTAAGENWHLFDTIDILKYSGGDTIHLPTSLLADQQMQLISSEQLPVPGVPFPDVDNGHLVSWGIVEGTNTGYIYVWSWARQIDLPAPSENNGDAFLAALKTLIKDYHIDGLIIDSRFNTGGFTYQYTQCLSLLFNQDQYTFEGFIRDDPNDHYSLKKWDQDITGFKADDYLFDGPVAMLIGPTSRSCGDIMPLQMREHPMVRTFGLGTNGAYGGVMLHEEINSTFSDWRLTTTYSNFSYADQSDPLLTHLYIAPDEEIWFTREDAVKGEDTVVKRALQWIQNLSYAHDVEVDKIYIEPSSGTVQISAQVENPNNHDLSILAYISRDDTTVVDSVYLTQKDSIWSTPWNAGEEENIYQVSVKTDDADAGTSRTIPNVAHFASAGPLVIDSISAVRRSNFYTERLTFDIYLKNMGETATIKNVKSTLLPDTSNPCFAGTDFSVYRTFGDIAAGESKVGTGFSIFMKESCHGDTIFTIPFSLDISSDGIVYWNTEYDLLVNVDENKEIRPLTFKLEQNYPNPFNAISNFEYRIPNLAHVNLSIYNLLGQKVATLVNKKQAAGSYKVQWDASSFSSGVYFYRLKAGKNFVKTNKLVVLK